MKKFIALYICLINCLLSFSEKKALVVAIGHYPSESKWPAISSANDVTLLNQIFSSYDLFVLEDADATHSNIVKAIISLTSGASLGDSVYIHFSCHGQQMLPTLASNADAEIDKLDEALVPYDAKKDWSDNYQGENHLRDDEMGVLLDSLRKKVGSSGFVLLTLDACFSDSMDRGKQKNNKVRKVRGGAEIFGANTISHDSLGILLKNRNKQEPKLSLKKDGYANIVILSACKSNQRNYEYEDAYNSYGSLSYAMYQSFLECGMTDLYKWLDCIYENMQIIAYSQDPQIRASLSYSFPSNENTSICEDIEIDDQTSINCLYLLVLIVILSVLILIVLSWLKLKNKL
ncbi:MAG: caspase family protein [Bacteroidales bacterium]|nr:caspase family protein [Bacteroidales bacterium]